MKQFEDETKAKANKRHSLEQAGRQQERPQVGRLLLIYVDDKVPDTTPFGTVRQQRIHDHAQETRCGSRPSF